ncbi:hypothetical protein A4R26_26360 [Niastella populi]|uniref:Uncharacterized protein n=1 Tax=Niastella populi TaxID=550983 RepID=A0A1V9FDD8_9BACT|nr:hypothetical protein A4R26_26360 [Niastella populi]
MHSHLRQRLKERNSTTAKKNNAVTDRPENKNAGSIKNNLNKTGDTYNNRRRKRIGIPVSIH